MNENNKFEIIKIVIFLIIIGTLINYGLHYQIIEQDKELRESAYNYVNNNCFPEQTKEWIINQNITLQWNLTQQT